MNVVVYNLKLSWKHFQNFIMLFFIPAVVLGSIQCWGNTTACSWSTQQLDSFKHFEGWRTFHYCNPRFTCKGKFTKTIKDVGFSLNWNNIFAQPHPKVIFFNVGPLKEDIFLSTFYGLHFSHLTHTYYKLPAGPLRAAFHIIFVSIFDMLIMFVFPWVTIVIVL